MGPHMPTAHESGCPMTLDASSNCIYSDWILPLLRELGKSSTCDRSFTTWESLEDLLELNEDARKRALKQKGGRGFPIAYNVFNHVLGALVEMGCEFHGPRHAMQLCAKCLAAHEVHIPQLENPSAELDELWQRTDRAARRRALRKALNTQATDLDDLRPDEAAFIDACTAIAMHCRVEASPTAANEFEFAIPPNTNPRKRITLDDGLDSPRPSTQRESSPRKPDSAGGPSPLAMLLLLLQGTRAPRTEQPLFDDGLGPVDYGVPSNEAELMTLLVPPALADRLAETGLQPADLCRAESFARGREVFARWISTDRAHRFAILVGRGRLAFTPLCDRALLLRRIKRLESTLADTPDNTDLTAGTISLIIRHTQGDEAQLLAALFTALTLGRSHLDLLDTIIRP